MTDEPTGTNALSGDGVSSPCDFFGASVLTDAVLAELKAQAEYGCLLCSLEAWESEEGD